MGAWGQCSMHPAIPWPGGLGPPGEQGQGGRPILCLFLPARHLVGSEPLLLPLGRLRNK